jgi:hypothetical protein
MQGFVPGFRLAQRCSLGFRCSGLWRRVTGFFVSDVSRQHASVIFKVPNVFRNITDEYFKFSIVSDCTSTTFQSKLLSPSCELQS